MPIVERAASKQHVKNLMDRVEHLREVLEGKEPSLNIWSNYALNEKDYLRDFVHIEEEDLTYAISDLEGILKLLKKAKTLKADKLHSSV